jgi:peptide/nickel transport system permease protein
MRTITISYLLRRLGFFIVVVWVAITLIFLLPRLAERNPISERIGAMGGTGGYVPGGLHEMVEAWEAKFGLDVPLWKQYLYFLRDTLHLDFGYSLYYFPEKVLDRIAEALPWSIGLLGVSTLIAFALGSLGGGLLAWPKAPRFLQYLLPLFLTWAAVPQYLLGLVILFLFAFTIRIFPLGGGYSLAVVPSLSFSFILDILYHAVLPSLALVLGGVGFFALQMRGMMVIGLEEDYITFAEAKGLVGNRIFFRYALRNVLLPQLTSLALALGLVVSGAILVEVVFGYPGLGTLLFKAASGFDYNLINGIAFFIIISVAMATLLLDLLYPRLDPRITYRRGMR